MSKETTCGVVRDLLPLYADDVASPDSRALVEEHLKGCAGCRAELAQLEQAVQLPPDRNEAGEVRRWKRGLNRWLGRTVALCLVIAAAAAALLLFLILDYRIGVTASGLEADSRKGGSAEDAPLLTQVVSKDLGFLMYDKGDGYVLYDLYVNRPGLDFGYHFWKRSSLPVQDSLYSLYSYSRGNSILVFSLTGSGVVRVEQTAEDSKVPGTVYLVEPDRPWAVIFPKLTQAEGEAYLTAYNTQGEVVPFTTAFVGQQAEIRPSR